MFEVGVEGKLREVERVAAAGRAAAVEAVTEKQSAGAAFAVIPESRVELFDVEPRTVLRAVARSQNGASGD